MVAISLADSPLGDNGNYVSSLNSLSTPEPTVPVVEPTEPVVECAGDDGYRGDLAVTVSGLECQAWDQQTPHKQSYTPDRYPDSGKLPGHLYGQW